MRRNQRRFIGYCLSLGLIVALIMSMAACSHKPTLSSIMITPESPPIIAVGVTQQFTAAGIYSDGSTKDITSEVIWTSSNTDITTVSSGSATTVVAGTVNITAFLSGITSISVSLISKPSLTLADASTLLNLSSELPSGFSASYMDPQPSDKPDKLLGASSGNEYLVRGTSIGTPDYYEIECNIWIADVVEAQQISASDALAETFGSWIVGPIKSVDVGNGSTAAGSGIYESGLELLMIKHQNAFVLIIAWYSHPENNFVPLDPLGVTIAERLSNYFY